MRVIDTEKIPIKLWLDEIEDGALAQAKNLANLPFAYRWIAIMPDSHEGYGMPIGGVMATRGVVVPNAVGVDIGCGMRAIKTSLKEIDTDTIKRVMGKARERIPVGFNHHKENQEWDGFINAPDTLVIQQELSSARRQLGTLGGGNHFLEIQMGSDGHVWLMVHSGSRNFGLKVAKYYHDIAKHLCERWLSDLPEKDLSFLPIEDKMAKDYMSSMNYCLEFARENRQIMLSTLCGIVHNEVGGMNVEHEIDVHHNYAVYEHHYGNDVLVHRKGAIKASGHQWGIIPGSMGTSSYIVQGLGNPESFLSSSHGAGRSMGRAQAKKRLDLVTEQGKMKNIVHGLRSINELDEAPGAYKDIDQVMLNQQDLVEIQVKLTPLAVIKG